MSIFQSKAFGSSIARTSEGKSKRRIMKVQLWYAVGSSAWYRAGDMTRYMDWHFYLAKKFNETRPKLFSIPKSFHCKYALKMYLNIETLLAASNLPMQPKRVHLLHNLRHSFIIMPSFFHSLFTHGLRPGILYIELLCVKIFLTNPPPMSVWRAQVCLT